VWVGLYVIEGREYALILKSFKIIDVRSGTQNFIFEKKLRISFTTVYLRVWAGIA
jgi:hypothetical protein